MRTISLINTLFLIFSLLQSPENPRITEADSSIPPARSEFVETSPSLAGMTVSLKAATNATILFKAENGQETIAPQEAGQKIPYLVLNRNGVLTPGFERTLDLSLGNLQVPSSGLYASLEIETQHSDPDLGQDSTDKILVWNEKRLIRPSPNSQAPQTIDFKVTFPRIFENQGQGVLTPTD
jgi:hypothetical protein